MRNVSNRDPSLVPALRSIVVIVCLLYLPDAWSQLVVLEMRNGDRLTGTILSEEPNQIIFKTTWWNVVVVPLAEIKSRQKAPPAAIEAQPGAGAKPAAGAPTTPPRPAAIAPPAPAPPQKPKYWAAEAQLGVDLILSDKQREIYTGRFKATYARGRFRNTFDYNFGYGRADGLLSDNRMYGTSKTDFDLTKHFYVYNLGGAGYDEIRKINSRFEVGPGGGYHVLKLTNFVFNLEAGANYQAQYQSDQTQTELFFFRFAEDAGWKINTHFSFDEKFEFFPQMDRWGRYRFRFETNLRYAFLSSLSLVVTVVDQYDTKPAQGIDQNDFQVRSALGLKF